MPPFRTATWLVLLSFLGPPKPLSFFSLPLALLFNFFELLGRSLFCLFQTSSEGLLRHVLKYPFFLPFFSGFAEGAVLIPPPNFRGNPHDHHKIHFFNPALPPNSQAFPLL